jgi:UDP-N-acetylmuramate--alanine ligase
VVNRVPFYGMAILCLDNPGVQAILPELHKRFVTYGISAQATYRARNIRPNGMETRYIAWRKAEELGEIRLPMPGHHNVLNSLAVLATCDFLEVPFETVAKGLEKFDGIQRRFTVRGEIGGITIIDDFGHHPTEVRATLAGARAGFAGRRIIAAFQPHRFSRTRDQFHEFARSFYDADKVIVCDVFGAGEQPIEGVSSDLLVDAIKDSGHTDVTYVPRREDVASAIVGEARPGDLVITLGAGNIQLTCNDLIEKLEANGGTAKVKNLVRI